MGAAQTTPLEEPLQGKRDPESPSARWLEVHDAWDRLQALPAEKREFLDHLEIANDCGLSEIGTKEELWSTGRYATALMLLLFVAYNIYFIFDTDYRAIMDPAPTYKQFLLTKSVVEKLGLHYEFFERTPQKGVFLMECVILVGLILNTLRQSLVAACSKGYNRWNSVVYICWYLLPELSTYSAIKLLQFVTPQQLSYNLTHILMYAPPAQKKWQLLVFLLTTPVILIIGLDCFLIKVRLANNFIQSEEGTLKVVLGSIILLTQILGVVQLSKTIKNRLYRFVFAGEDGIMTEEEQVRQDVWEAMVCQRMFEMYTREQAVALMLSWNDNDFQMMALNEDESKAH
eukprot:TRINITY_DN91308_c0_g1_i1.p1 TRINITY_DN91308_c0_g1~~TRINITY_DN91308_c0_g1_i1.p1  ORF type:complete len:344 (-),score=90.20 TRINITY_DN91308_c0_g1_i1:270-1301(-)